MKFLKLIILYVLFLEFGAGEAVSRGDSDIVSQYFNIETLVKYRKEKDEFLNKKDSPIPGEELSKFSGLNYYQPKIEFVFTAKLEPFKIKDTVEIRTSKKEKLLKMLKYGYFLFKYNDSTYKLTAFLGLKKEAAKALFVPFTDLTNEAGSYHGGRYIDVGTKTYEGYYILDFNMAYNPFCAYNNKYICPLVPYENNLDFKVEAGEKEYVKPVK